jgi:hypothetical protein
VRAEPSGLSNHDVGLPTETIPRQLASVLAPLDRRALGVAIGTFCGLAIYLLTVHDLLLRPEPALSLELLSQYFPGYSVSWTGGLAGAAWAFGVGFCAGWLSALSRNLAIALWILFIRGKHEMAATRDFLDQI